MSGHRKYVNTKHKKYDKDAKKKIIKKYILSSSKIVGKNYKNNYKLRHIISKALYNNIKKDI